MQIIKLKIQVHSQMWYNALEGKNKSILHSCKFILT